MIKEWKLDNFKSIDKEKDLEFRPLTIFTGANSSGKSTILQSILLVTQTLQSPIASRSIVLNGWFKKFGSYSDVVNKREFNKNIRMGFTILNDGEVETPNDHYVRFMHPDGISGAQCEFEVSSDGKDECLQPLLEYTRIGTMHGKEKAERVMTASIEKTTERSDDEQKVIEMIGSKFQQQDFAYTLKTTIRPRLGYYGVGDNWKILGTGLYHFLPSYLIGYTSYKDQMKRVLTECLMSGRKYYFDSEDDIKNILPYIESRVYEIVEDIYKKEGFRDKEKYERARTLIKKKISITRIINILSLGTLSGEKQKYVNYIVEGLDKLPEQYAAERMPLFHVSGVDFIRDFFNEKIKYLGPLREEPRSLYPLESNGNTFDLGLKGENTAAVFENNKTRKIKYVNPACFEGGKVGELKPEEDTLSEAINKWLVYLGVANEMSTNDRGKVGHELKITTDIQDMQQDLTHVGVGVSQILPILVMCFLAGKGDSIILEQPELHLHPKVQTRLADFFVSMNALGKQCLLETHSEYLINRLRYLVAKSVDEKVANDTMIYFVEKEDGHSIYSPITINKYGVIDDWPKGFFDESEDIATMIMRAGVEKRRSEIKK